MEQYIKKDNLIAEIDKRIKILQKNPYENHKIICHLDSLKQSISTLEVKEVNLEKEIQNHIKECLDIKFPTTDVELIKKDVAYTARKFFELGLQARTDKELVEEVYSYIDSIKNTADRMTSGNFMHHRAAIKVSANTIAKVLELMGLKAQKGE